MLHLKIVENGGNNIPFFTTTHIVYILSEVSEAQYFSGKFRAREHLHFPIIHYLLHIWLQHDKILEYLDQLEVYFKISLGVVGFTDYKKLKQYYFS